MAWIGPPTFVVGAVLTAAQMNVLGGDLVFLSGVSANVAAGSVSTSSAPWVALGGPSTTATTGGNACVFIMASIANTSALQSSFIGVAVSGASSISAPAGTNSMDIIPANTAGEAVAGMTFISGLNPGANTFTLQYGAGGGTAEFGSRTIVVFPLP